MQLLLLFVAGCCAALEVVDGPLLAAVVAEEVGWLTPWPVLAGEVMDGAPRWPNKLGAAPALDVGPVELGTAGVVAWEVPADGKLQVGAALSLSFPSVVVGPGAWFVAAVSGF